MVVRRVLAQAVGISTAGSQQPAWQLRTFVSSSRLAADYDINSRSKPHVNVGTIGHVDHGKTTLTAAITKVCMHDSSTGCDPCACLHQPWSRHNHAQQHWMASAQVLAETGGSTKAIAFDQIDKVRARGCKGILSLSSWMLLRINARACLPITGT